MAQKKKSKKERAPAQKTKKTSTKKPIKKTINKKKTTTNKKVPKKKTPKKKATKKATKKKPTRKKNNSNSVSNVFNVGRYIRKDTSLKVSPTFIEEAKGRIEDLLTEIVPEAVQMAKAEKMKTLQEHHLIRVYDFRKPVDYRIVSCSECKHAFGVTGSDIDNDLSCPFCHKKRGIIKE